MHQTLECVVVVMIIALLLQVERLETRVVAPLKAYGDIVRNKRVSLDTMENQKGHMTPSLFAATRCLLGA